MRVVATLVLLIHPLAAPAQTPPAAATPHYDVVSVKPTRPDFDGMYWRSARDGFTAHGVTLSALIMNAYNTRQDLISGLPAWAETARFDVNAKIVDPDLEALKKLNKDELRAMMAEVFSDRFHLKIHSEIRELPVYDLVLAKDGSRLRTNPAMPVKSDPGKPMPAMGPGMVRMSFGEFTGIAIPLSSFIYSISSLVQRNVIDRTGLIANYDIHLKWTPDRDDAAGPNSGPPDDTSPPLFTALQEQLGLKLIPAKGPVQTWVVDHVELPTEN